MPNEDRHCDVGNGLGSRTRVFTNPLTAGTGRAVDSMAASRRITFAAGADGSAASIVVAPAIATAVTPPWRSRGVRRFVGKMTLPGVTERPGGRAAFP